MKFIHVTDPHLVAPGRSLWGGDPAALLDRCLADIERHHGDAAFCVISGDIADSGETAAYGWMKDRLERFSLPTFLLLGNHDDRGRFKSVFTDHPCDAGGFIQQAHAIDAGMFLFLDTLKEGGGSEGAYCEERRAWLREQLAAAQDRPVYLFLHHPPFDIGIDYMDVIKLEDAEAFGEVIEQANIRHLFCGHVHRALYTSWRGIACTSLPGTNHQVPLVTGSVATSYSREPAMIGVVTIESDGRVLVHFDACLDRKTAEGS